MKHLKPAATIAITFFVWPAFVRAADEPVQAAIRQRVEQLRTTRSLRIDGAPIAAVRFLPSVYERRDYAPLWTDPATVQALRAEIDTSPEDGLDPGDFNATLLDRMQQAVFREGGASADARADFDLLMTDALTRLGYQLFWGKVDPERLDTNWNFDRPLLEGEPAAALERAVSSGDLSGFLDRLELKHPAYLRMKELLRRYRGIEAKGGWPSIPAGPNLEPGMRDARVSALRTRLEAEGYAQPSSDGSGDLYDEALTDAVRTFQARHALSKDGVVGSATRAELNVPVERRIDTIRINMERARWVLRNLGDEFVLVNVAGFHVYVVREGKRLWETRSIVGKPYRQTPVFRGDMTYLEFNPTWTVPPTILRKDMLPRLRSDPGYFARNNFRIVDANGRTVSASAARAKASGSFPYQIVQQPGADNALGRVKFMFPNRHSVYLHDTPNRALFGKPERTFSSGCIRLEHPMDLAEILLAGDPTWSRDRIDTVVASDKTTRVTLPKPVPVLILYWTVAIEGDRVTWYRDIYGRDAKLLAALNEPFSPLRPRPRGKG